MKGKINLITAVALAAAFFSAIHLSAGNIVYPWRAAKSIVQAGESFSILYNNLRADIVDSVLLEGPFNRVVLQIDSVVFGRFEYDSYTNSSVNNKIYARVPAGTPEELYTLVIKNGGEIYTSNKSVKVVKEFKESHSFIHISDLHISRNWVETPEGGYAKELELFDNFVKVANIIAPDFILNTGDNIHETTRFNPDSTGWGGDLNSEAHQRPLIEEKWKNFYEGSNGLSGIHGLNAPVFSIPGNHDYYGMPKNESKLKALQWNNLCGLRVYGFSYRETRIIMSDNCIGNPDDDYPLGATMSGLQGKVFESFFKENGVGRINILGQHRYHDRLDGGSLIDTAFLDKYKINMLLHGHFHKPFHEYIGATPTLGTRPGTVCKSGYQDPENELGFFRIFRINGAYFEFSEPLRFIKDPTVPYEEMELNLTLDYSSPNDGSATYNSAIIINNLDINLPGCQIRFIMKKGKYKVNTGRIYQVIESGNYSVVDVRVDIDSLTKNDIKITKL